MVDEEQSVNNMDAIFSSVLMGVTLEDDKGVKGF